MRDCIAAFGFSSASWAEAVRRGAITARPAGLPIADLLIAGTYRGRYNLKLRLIKEGLKENRCERCGLTEWRGQRLTVALHHSNGDRHDNRLENLEFLCPNCHSQTETLRAGTGATASVPELGRPPAPTRRSRHGSTRPPAERELVQRSARRLMV